MPAERLPPLARRAVCDQVAKTRVPLGKLLGRTRYVADRGGAHTNVLMAAHIIGEFSENIPREDDIRVHDGMKIGINERQHKIVPGAEPEIVVAENHADGRKFIRKPGGASVGGSVVDKVYFHTDSVRILQNRRDCLLRAFIVVVIDDAQRYVILQSNILREPFSSGSI